MPVLAVEYEEPSLLPSSSQVAESSPRAVLYAGALSGLAARFVTHPLDTVKARLQVIGSLQLQVRGSHTSHLGPRNSVVSPPPRDRS